MLQAKRVALAALVLALQCAAQTPAELLQKGIYAQETAGDAEGALKIYREITATAPSQSAVAAQAQYRIAEVMLQKGDLNGAAIEFTTLATRYSEHQALIAKMATRLRGERSAAGVLRDGRYRNKRTGIEIAVTAPWKTTYDGPSSDDGDMVGLTDGSSMDYGVWMRPEASTAAEIPEKLRASVPAKVKMNTGVPGFAFRPESIQPRTIGGQQALSAVADYVEDGKKLVALYIWIYTPKTHVVFLARDVPVEDLAAAQSRLEQLASGAVVP